MKKIQEIPTSYDAESRIKINEIIEWINHAACLQTIKDNKRIIPIQTPNSDTNQRLMKNIEDVLINAKSNIRRNLIDNAEIRIDTALQYLYKLANGETPEEDNTVGSKYVRDSILYNLRNHTKEAWPKESIGETKILSHIMYIFNQFKPVETTRSSKTLNIGETLEADNTEGQDQMIKEVRNYLTTNSITWSIINNTEDIIRGNFNRMKK